MTDIMAALQHIDTLLKARRFADASRVASKLTEEYPESADGWQRLGYVQEVTGDFSGMLASYQNMSKLRPRDLGFALKTAQALVQNGKVCAALTVLDTLAKKANDNPETLQHVGQLFTSLSAFEKAYACYDAAAKQAPTDTGVLYNLASAATAVGKLDEAERLYSEVIALKPADYDAYYNRSTLKKQTIEANNIDAMEALLKAGIPDHKGAVQLFYALAKEYEDLGQAEPSFAHLERGANLRAAMMSYDVAEDVAAMEQIKATYTADFVAQTLPQKDGSGPIFVVGLPRTGTTLVDRILCSHSKVESLGEINDFALGLMRFAGKNTNKTDLIVRSADLDFKALGKDYLRCTAERGSGTAYLIDKTPANFLYLGLIARALPNAKIIHLRRGAMDSCYAIYKTLFRMGYPYSYRQEDLALYYVAYHGLMDHWRTIMPGRFIDVDYEALVSDQEAQTNRLLAHCGLDFEPACVDFHKNTTPTATASAAQVREPIHSGSVEKWRQYERELAPLKVLLEAASIDTQISETAK